MTAVKPRRTSAVFAKQLKDTLKNKATLIQFLMFPILALVFTQAIGKSQPGIAPGFFVVVFATVYAGFVPMMNMASIIAEEKEQGTLQALMMANVKPRQYLLGVGGYVLLLCLAGSLAMGLIGRYAGTQLLLFCAVMMVGCFASLVLGAAVGLLAKNQMSATAMAMPVAMAFGFIPMLATFNQGIEPVARVLYTGQVGRLLGDLTPAAFTAESLGVIGANLALFLLVFAIAYKKGTLLER